MFQRGEVDYLVATDAIGMGLNMDVTHVAFAGLSKFDGRRERRLTISEMAQIAGRAGRHQRDGSFGTLALGGEKAPEFSEEEIAAIEEHRFRPLDHLYWRSADLDFSSTTNLIASLETPSDDPLLRSAPLAIDLAVLKLIAEDPTIAATRERQARKLWAACGLPDFRKVGAMHHARMVRRLFSYIGEGGHIPHEWFAAEVARLDNVTGDIETLADRIAGVRSWAYIAQRPDWLADPAKWAERTRAVEGRLSDALHERLTQRFVDRRTAVLVRDIGARGADALPVTVAADGEVSVGPEPIGHLAGFDFKVDPTARLADKRLLLAAAERRLGEELDRRAARLCDAPDAVFKLVTDDAIYRDDEGTEHVVEWVTQQDVDLARRITEIAADHKVDADPASVSEIELGLDTARSATVAPVWAALLTGSVESQGRGTPSDEIRDATGRVPNLWFGDADEGDSSGPRFHVEVYVAPEAAEQRIAAAVAAGGTVVDDSDAPSLTVIADQDGNRGVVCVDVSAATKV
jgi:hypothetical protein